MQSPTRRTARLAPLTLASLLVLAQLGVLLTLAPSAGAAPLISGISPTSGSENGGTTVTITGTGFVTGAHVMFNDGTNNVPATNIAVAGATSITAVTPAILTNPPARTVTVINPDGTQWSISNAFTFTAATSPTVTSVTPASGSATGAFNAIITGTNFVSGAIVTAGAGSCGALTNPVEWVVNSVTASLIAATVVGHAAGSVTVCVKNPVGATDEAGKTDAFLYSDATDATISALTPNQGPNNGGTTVTITGTGFAPGTMVKFGTAFAESVVFSSSTSLSVVTPKSSLVGGILTTGGIATVSVITPDGTSATSIFSYTGQSTNAPTVTGISPTQGPAKGGTTITIAGPVFHTGSIDTPTV